MLAHLRHKRPNREERETTTSRTDGPHRVLAACRKAKTGSQPENSDRSGFAGCAEELLVQDPKEIDDKAEDWKPEGNRNP
jgi:hypothetical protein